jgi:PASTA domain-containing protein
MNRIFAITAASDYVLTGGDGRGEITFTVTNSSARNLRGQLRVRPLGSTKGEWLNIAGENERAFTPYATQQVVVKVATPPGAPAGKYQFRLDALSTANPDDDFTEGPTVALEVKATEAPKKAFPWWIVAAGAGGLILIVTLTWLLWPSGGVEAPDVVGLDVAEATKKLEDLKFKVEVTKQLNSTVGLNRVFSQDPQGKTTAKEGAVVMLFVASQKPDETKVIYEENFNEFDKDLSIVWSNQKAEVTPNGRTRFLGQFGSTESVRLTLDRLPPHKTVTVKFDLYVLRSWDGDQLGLGPDVFGLKLEDTAVLINTTFTNVENFPQRFACKSGEETTPACMVAGARGPFGAAAINTLGFGAWESIHKIKRTFAHDRSFLMLTFFGELKEQIHDESWGLDNVRIEAQ